MSVACSGARPAAARNIAVPSTRAATVAGCPRGVADKRRGVLHGELDGDSKPEVVEITVARRASAACRYALLVKTGTGGVVTHTLSTSASIGGAVTRLPRVDSLVDLGDSRRQLAAIQIDRAASFVTLRLFHFTNATVHELRPDDGSTLTYGASLANIAGINCVPGDGANVVVSSTAQRLGSRWRVRRSFYRASRHLLRRASVTTLVVLNVRQFPEFKSSRAFPAVVDFPSCATARS